MATSNQFTDSTRPTARESLVKLVDLMIEFNLKIDLLNERFESVHDTAITLKDVENGHNTRE